MGQIGVVGRVVPEWLLWVVGGAVGVVLPLPILILFLAMSFPAGAVVAGAGFVIVTWRARGRLDAGRARLWALVAWAATTAVGDFLAVGSAYGPGRDLDQVAASEPALVAVIVIALSPTLAVGAYAIARRYLWKAPVTPPRAGP